LIHALGWINDLLGSDVMRFDQPVSRRPRHAQSLAHVTECGSPDWVQQSTTEDRHVARASSARVSAASEEDDASSGL